MNSNQLEQRPQQQVFWNETRDTAATKRLEEAHTRVSSHSETKKESGALCWPRRGKRCTVVRTAGSYSNV